MEKGKQEADEEARGRRVGREAHGEKGGGG